MTQLLTALIDRVQICPPNHDFAKPKQVAEMNDEEWRLVESARRGDEQAWRVLVDRHWGGIYRYILGKCRNHHLAEEVTQEALGKAAIKIAQLRVAGSFAGWLRRIARTTLADRLRVRRVRQAPDGSQFLDIDVVEVEADRAGSADPLAHAIERELAEFVAKALAGLPDDERAAAIWRWVDNLPLPVVTEKPKAAFPDMWARRTVRQVGHRLQKVRESLKPGLQQLLG